VKKYIATGTIFSSFFQFSHAAKEGVSPKAYELTELPLGLPITNSMLTAWIVSLILILVVRKVVKSPRLIPSKGQALFEVMVDGMKSLIKPIVGDKMVRHTLPLIVTLFFFILIHNWTGLLPTVAAFGHYNGEDFLYYFRPANSDLNNTIALAVVAMVCWLFLVLKHAGIKTLLFDVFGNKADKKETPRIFYLCLFPLFLVVGFVELLSISIRPVSLSLRLFGNIFGGESLLDKMLTMTQWYIPVAFPFYFFELMVGFVQALVFVILVSVYIGLVCNHESHDAHH